MRLIEILCEKMKLKPGGRFFEFIGGKP